TEAAIRAMVAQIRVVSAERIAEELRQLLVHPQRVRGMNLLYDVGLVAPILEELAPMKGLPQGPPAAPTGDLWDHVMRVLDLLRADALASGRSIDHVAYCEQLLAEWSAEDLNPAPLLTGHDLQRLGMEPGPQFKRILDGVREAQLEASIATHEEALALARRLA